MATVAAGGKPKPKSLAPDLVEKVIAVGSVVMLGALLFSLARGFGTWSHVPAIVWLHLVTIGTALALTPLLMLRRRGDRWHRRLGWAWSVAMFSTAVISIGIRSDDGRLSFIHLFSLLTIVSVPLLVFAARAHKVEKHRSSVRGLIIGALLIAGVLTFIPGRTLGNWMFG